MRRPYFLFHHLDFLVLLLIPQFIFIRLNILDWNSRELPISQVEVLVQNHCVVTHALSMFEADVVITPINIRQTSH